MKSRLKDIKRYLWDVLLFSGIGCFSYFLLVYYADIPSQYQDRLMTFQAFSAVVVLFNGVGLSVKYINEKLMMYYLINNCCNHSLHIQLPVAGFNQTAHRVTSSFYAER